MTEDKFPDTPSEDVLDQLLSEEEGRGILSSSLKTMPRVHVPSDFVPAVMSKVYTHHARSKVNLLHAAVIVLILVAVAVAFFAWDTYDFMAANNIDEFGRGLAKRLDLMLNHFSHTAASASELLTAAWQIVGATGKAFIAKPVRFLYLLLVLAVMGGLIFVRKWVLRG